MKKNEAIKNLFLFKGSDFTFLDKKYNIVNSCIEQHFSDGELIFSSDSKEGLPIVLSGRAKIVSGSDAVLRFLGEGDCFGAATVFDSSEEHRTAVYSVGECSVVILPLSKLKNILLCEGECSMKYIAFLSGKVSFLNRKISAFTAGSAEARLAVYLSGLYYENGMAILDQSHTQLSQMLGIGRASLYRAFDSLEASGAIKKDGHKITLHNIDIIRNLIK